ncbi:hypothetical protein bpuCAU1_001288 (plasmid) [Borrelia puertoricensis]|nr:hypothetical protein [Borrelia puertoricensis]UPA19018.1 hypothetical protein bpuSUM_001561 [Borrelia puertoricensis]
MLNSLDNYCVVRIIDIYRDIKINQDEALNAIDIIFDVAVKQDFQVSFNNLKSDYDSHIREAFNKSSGELFFQLTNDINKYLGSLMLLQAMP